MAGLNSLRDLAVVVVVHVEGVALSPVVRNHDARVVRQEQLIHQRSVRMVTLLRQAGPRLPPSSLRSQWVVEGSHPQGT
jgi:hypothetical protein